MITSLSTYKSINVAGEKKPLASLTNQAGIGIADLTCEYLLNMQLAIIHTKII